MKPLDFIHRMALYAMIVVVMFPLLSLACVTVVSFFTGFYLGVTGQ